MAGFEVTPEGDWLPCVFQTVTPWMSKDDLRIGVRWSYELAKALERTEFGIVCITEENRASPWIMFEAGALSKALDRGRVAPYLIDMPIHLLDGPLAQFQGTTADLNGTKQLVDALAEANDQNKQDPRTIDRVFEVWWPKFGETLAEIDAHYPVPKVRRPDIRVFTTSDVSILRHLADRKSRSEISAALTITAGTLQVRIQQLVLKLNAANLEEALDLAREFDLI